MIIKRTSKLMLRTEYSYKWEIIKAYIRVHFASQHSTGCSQGETLMQSSPTLRLSYPPHEFVGTRRTRNRRPASLNEADNYDLKCLSAKRCRLTAKRKVYKLRGCTERQARHKYRACNGGSCGKINIDSWFVCRVGEVEYK